MNKLIVLILVAAAGLLAYNYYQTGKLTLIPSAVLSEEEQQVDQLARAFQAAQKELNVAGRSAAVGGLDTTGDVEAHLREVERIDGELSRLQDRLTSPSAKEEAQRLAKKIKVFKADAGL